MQGQAGFTIRLIGPFGLFTPGGSRVAVTSKKAMAMLALLATAPDGERTRVWLQDQLWGSRGAGQAQASLRRELSSLRQVLANAGGDTLLTADHNLVALDLGQVTTDFARLMHPAGDAPPLSEGAGDFLEGLDLPGEEGFEEWLRLTRSRVADQLESLHQSSGRQSRAVIDRLIPAGERSGFSRPSVAVMPLSYWTDVPDGAALADGIVEELTLALSRFSTLMVIAAGTSLTFRDPRRDRGEVCRELGVRYLLEGSIRHQADQVRITVKLIDGLDQNQVWADRFDGAVTDIFDLQDRIASTVAPLIDSTIEKTERLRALARPVESLDAYQLYWRANAAFRNWGPAGMREAISLAEAVLQLEPANSWAASLIAFCHGTAYSSGWTDDPEATRAASLDAYARALQHGSDDPFVLGYAAGTLMALQGDMEVADRLIDRALDLQPNASATLFWGAWVDVNRGNMARAKERFTTILRINPRSAVRPHMLTGLSMCLLIEGRAADAQPLLVEALQHLPDHPITLAAGAIAHALTGQPARAQELHKRLVAVGGVSIVTRMLRNEQQAALANAGLELAARGA